MLSLSRPLAHSRIGALALALVGLTMPVTSSAATLVDASLRSGDYGSGAKIDMFTSCGDASGRTCGNGNLSEIGLVESAEGTRFTSTQSDSQSNAVVSWYLAGLSSALVGSKQVTFRTQGTLSFAFRADPAGFVGGHLFSDNKGFNSFHNGQGSFSSGASRNNGTDGIAGTADDKVSIGWNSWHTSLPGNWRAHGTGLASIGEWHRLGVTWGGPAHDFELWIDGVLAAYDDPFAGAFQAWGDSAYSGSGANIALGDIHERGVDGENGVAGMTFADLRIWNEAVAFGDALPIPEPGTAVLIAAGCAVLGWRRERRTQAR
jgi:hypothetical protein